MIRFSAENEVNIIIMGKFEVDDNTNQIVTESYIYSVAQKKVVTHEIYKGDIDSELYRMIDEIALEIIDETENRIDELSITVQEIIKNASPPEYKVKPHITNISSEGVEVSWETNKETASSLYVLSSDKFDNEYILNEYQSLSENAVSHIITIPFENLDKETTKYMVSYDVDFLGNEIDSGIIEINIKDLQLSIQKVYSEEKGKIIQSVDKLISDGDKEQAITLLQDILNNIIPKYQNIIDIEDDIQEIKNKIKTLQEDDTGNIDDMDDETIEISEFALNKLISSKEKYV